MSGRFLRRSQISQEVVNPKEPCGPCPFFTIKLPKVYSWYRWNYKKNLSHRIAREPDRPGTMNHTDLKYSLFKTGFCPQIANQISNRNHHIIQETRFLEMMKNTLPFIKPSHHDSAPGHDHDPRTNSLLSPCIPSHGWETNHRLEGFRFWLK